MNHTPSSSSLQPSSDANYQMTFAGSEQQQPIRQIVDMPVARVRRIMKSDADVRTISQEAVVLVSKAAEKLIEHLARESLKNTIRDNRKTVNYNDLSEAVKSQDYFDFLEDIIPERKTLESILEAAKKEQ
ncbi:predicted protein [Naegleria gruberi]|uniref:Chromatin accessibility complex protein 1 n=1 Tax=Naegleria gruberi TaxID=5762 RepID=D2W5G2_NAEGR|nr:uncharacterized protein NAEGRDRAFT_54797 [Naegleria gruberi]EFC35693.1 predicted protein [Naegleria gruberi]|eukprot:XP_002668437.1 predicted protein [Naegleria gruberi strain NEG-M]